MISNGSIAQKLERSVYTRIVEMAEFSVPTILMLPIQSLALCFFGKEDIGCVQFTQVAPLS